LRHVSVIKIRVNMETRVNMGRSLSGEGVEMRRARLTTEERIRRFESMYPGVEIEPARLISCGAPVGNEVW
jgi:hypothetical protein